MLTIVDKLEDFDVARHKQFEKILNERLYYEPVISGSEKQKFIRDYYESYGGSLLQIYYTEDDIVYGGITLSSHLFGKIALENFVVATSHSGKAIGAKLINKALQWAKQRGLTDILLDVDSNDTYVHDIYYKKGFKRTGFTEVVSEDLTLIEMELKL